MPNNWRMSDGVITGLWFAGWLGGLLIVAGCAPRPRPQEDDKFVTVRTNDGRVQVMLLSAPDESTRASEISPLVQESVDALLDYEGVRLHRLNPNGRVRWDFHVDPENLVVGYYEDRNVVEMVLLQQEDITHTLTDHEKEAVARVCKETLPLHKKLKKLELFRKLHAARVARQAKR